MLLVLDGQHEFTGEHGLGCCEQFNAFFAELLDFRVGVSVFVALFYDMSELGQVYFINKIAKLCILKGCLGISHAYSLMVFQSL